MCVNHDRWKGWHEEMSHVIKVLGIILLQLKQDFMLIKKECWNGPRSEACVFSLCLQYLMTRLVVNNSMYNVSFKETNDKITLKKRIDSVPDFVCFTFFMLSFFWVRRSEKIFGKAKLEMNVPNIIVESSTNLIEELPIIRAAKSTLKLFIKTNGCTMSVFPQSQIITTMISLNIKRYLDMFGASFVNSFSIFYSMHFKYLLWWAFFWKVSIFRWLFMIANAGNVPLVDISKRIAQTCSYNGTSHYVSL